MSAIINNTNEAVKLQSTGTYSLQKETYFFIGKSRYVHNKIDAIADVF
jgi:hypothetical protein